jgi:3-phosphoshikimate 1-carboxyvinyltransferase
VSLAKDLVTIKPSSVKGIITAPPSKSAMQRACALALLNDGETIISNAGRSNDDLAAINIIKALGTNVEWIDDSTLSIKSTFSDNVRSSSIDCGESGLSLRMFTFIAALSDQEITINGKGSLLERPIDLFEKILPQLGVSIRTNNGKLPITIKGPLKPKDITIDGSVSSQYLTGLLMAYAKRCTESVAFSVTDLKSKPYIDLTLEMMGQFGWWVENSGYSKFVIGSKVKGETSNVRMIVEGDWSGAAFFLVAGAIAGSITVKGLRFDSAQADKKILKVLKEVGAEIDINNDEITVSRGQLKPFTLDATDCPDLFPPLVVLAAYCKGTSMITGADRLKHKESDRGETLKEEFAKMGIRITVKDNLMEIEGDVIQQAEVSSHNDHRIAMACAIAALGASGPITISNAGAVNKSCPAFYTTLTELQNI